jgi:predicted metal-dependent phosphoesterase TrpH
VRVDLHTHSSVSDGTDPPAQLVRIAADAGLDVVALTDHDTTEGWSEAVRALPEGLALVPGAEFSCRSADGRGGYCTVHLLGYLFDSQARPVREEQARLREQRRSRLRKMADRMAADGLPIDPDEVFGGLSEDVPAGRPHLAMALVRAGVVDTVDEAFAHHLNSGGRYHVRREDTPVLDAIAMIAEAGGATVLAHPFASHRGPTVTAEVIGDLAEHGLTGVEVDHPDHDEPTRAELRELASRYRLLRTGSSDYHGTNKLNRIGQDTTDPEQFDALVSRASGTKVVRA